MREIYIIDTSVFLNILDIPGFNQNREVIFNKLASLIEKSNVNLLLPFATIIETGNHVAQLSDGRQRRRYAERFTAQVKSAVDGEAPWTPTQSMDLLDLSTLLRDFPDSSMRGIGLGDQCIIREWEQACSRHPRDSIRIWSLDGHLSGYVKI